MGKYVKERCENIEELRKYRKSFYLFFFIGWFFIALSVALSNTVPSPEADYWTIGELLTYVCGVIAFVLIVKSFIQMKKVINLIYVRQMSFFILYLVLFIGGFATGILFIIPLILIWVHSAKLIKDNDITYEKKGL